MDWSPLGSSVHRILQTRLQEWVAISFSKGSSQPGDHLILWADSLLSALKTGKMLHEAFIFKKLFILYWSTVSQQCCDSFRWTTKGLGHTHVHVSPRRPWSPEQSSLPHSGALLLIHLNRAVCACPCQTPQLSFPSVPPPSSPEVLSVFFFCFVSKWEFF